MRAERRAEYWSESRTANGNLMMLRALSLGLVGSSVVANCDIGREPSQERPFSHGVKMVILVGGTLLSIGLVVAAAAAIFTLILG